MGFLDLLQEKFMEKKLKVKLNSVLYDEETEFATFKFQYDLENITNEIKDLIFSIIQSGFPGLDFEIKFKKYFYEKKLVIMQVLDFVKDNYTNISDISEDNIFYLDDKTLVVKVSPSNFEYLTSVDFEKEIKNYLDMVLFDDINLKLLLDDKISSNSSSELLSKRENILLNGLYSQIIKNDFNIAEITQIEQFIGEKISGECFYPNGLKTEIDNINIVGELKFLSNNKFKGKKKDAEGNEIEKDYFTFEISHNGEEIRCVFFPKIADVEKAKTMQNGDKVIVNGKLENNKDHLNLKVKNISKCDFEKTEIEESEIEFKKANENYVLIKPEPYSIEEQANFFMVEKKPTDFLKNNEFVVFDLETTGTELPACEITEIGAVKIINGKIAETFTTLVKPKSSISELITKLTGIDDDLVKDAPSINEVLPDFYKFCDGAVLVAYNIAFDYKFINHYGLQCGYKFDNAQIDAMYLARIGIPGLTRFRLKDAVDKLGISLVNAHRALNDTIATAKVFLELSSFAEGLI